MSGKAAACTSVGTLNPSSLTACTSSAFKPACLKLFVDCASVSAFSVLPSATAPLGVSRARCFHGDMDVSITADADLDDDDDDDDSA